MIQKFRLAYLTQADGASHKMTSPPNYHEFQSSAMDIDAAPHPSLPRDLITLNVSGTLITTAKSTLRTSLYFRSLISRWEEGMEMLPDGSVFIDADPDVFRIILNYMRRPSIYPFLWSREKGFDHAMYSRVMAEADFFMLEDLRDWIRMETYRKAVVVRHKTEIKPATPYWFDYPRQNAFRNFGHTEEDDKTVNTLDVSHVELVKMFAVDIPGTGGHECPTGRTSHVCMEDCGLSECVDPNWDETPEYVFPKEKVSQSLVFVWKLTTFNMSFCSKKY
jgi:hypothetical protein